MALPKFVVSLDAVQLGEVAELVRIPLVLIGRWVKGAQKFSITRADLRKLAENFSKRKTGETVIDYEHASEFPELARGGPVPAAGWLKEIEAEPDAQGVLWGGADFTTRAREMIERREYKYLSPAIDWGARDKVSGEAQGATLTSVALVNRPFLEALPAIQLSETGWTLQQEERKAMPEKTRVRLAEGDDKGKVHVTCGECGKESLSAEALQTPKDDRKIVQLSEVKRDKEGLYDFTSIQTGDGVLIAGEVFRAMEVQRALDAAVKDGKILPAQRRHYEKLALSDLGGFRELVRSMKAQVDLSEHGIAGEGGEGGDMERVDRQIREKVKARMGEKKDETYGQAFKAVLGEHPDLAKERTRLMREQ